jgi:hypothetical protein
MTGTNFYCQKICGEENFSIDEWNETARGLDTTNMLEVEKQAIPA